MSGLEAATYVSDLVSTNPAASDPKAQGDDHIRLIKSAAQASFPNASRAFYIPTSVAAQVAGPTVNAAAQGKIYPINATGGAITVALPAGAGLPDGYEVTVFKSDSSSNAVIIDPNSSETINGATTFSLSKQFQGMRCIWLSTYAAWIGEHWIAAIPYFSGGQDIAFTDIAPSANAKRILAATTATDWSEHTITAILEFVSASLARGDILMRGASAFDRFAPGTSGYFLKSAGAGSDLVWTSPVSAMPARAYAEVTTLQSLTTVIPIDNTIPQNTEGDQFLTASITPSATTSRIRITFHCFATISASFGSIALFRDSGADAIQATATDADSVQTYSFMTEDAPATTSSVTYKVRGGPSSAGQTLYINGGGGSRLFGGAGKATLVLQEIFV